jgi:hypothetical protein
VGPKQIPDQKYRSDPIDELIVQNYPSVIWFEYLMHRLILGQSSKACNKEQQRLISQTNLRREMKFFGGKS